jgi:tetratricopeptide (TPR) repeat protein
MIKRLLFSKKFWGVFLFSFFLVIYILTLCPTVFWWDSGEFIANIAVLGIPHRPGFPIYILLGKFFSLFPLFNLAFKINLLSALFSAFSLLIFYFAFWEILNLFFTPMAQKKTEAIVSASTFVLVLGFTYSFWIQAVRAEVYSLSLLFFSLLLYLSLRYLATGHLKYIYLFFFILGLGLGNHHLSLLSTTPALFFLLLCSPAHNKSVIHNFSFVINLRRLPLYVLFLLLGLSIYLYLPLRSSGNPVLAWGDTKSISGSASSVFALESLKNLNLDFLSNIWEKISGIIRLFFDQLTWVCFLISLVGVIFLTKYGKRILIFLIFLILCNCASVIFVATEFISTNLDLHGYLLSSLFGLAFSYGLGVLLIADRVRNRSSFLRRFALIIFLLISFIPLSRHFTYADLSNNRIAYNYGYNTIHDLDSNSIIFVDNVNLNFILRELQYAEGIRKDLKIIDRGRLNFPWYADQKRKELKNTFSDIPGNLTGEAFFQAILEKCLDRNIPTYMEFTEADSNLVDYLIPSGYVLKLSKKRIDQIPEEILLSQKKWEKDTFFGLNDDSFKRDWDAQRVFALSLYRLGLFYEKRGMISYALDKFEKVGKIDPHNAELTFKIEELRKAQRFSESTSPHSAF